MKTVDAANDSVGDKDRRKILFGRFTVKAAFWRPTATTFSKHFP
jgi:hypothetical protein